MTGTKVDTTSAPVARLLTDKESLYFQWINEPALRTLCKTLEDAHPDGVRFVGGCVRDGLLGHASNDIDIATTIPPQVVMALLQTAGIKVIPTGIDHGTVTAVLTSGPIEITTLRRDVSTDGRRATVSYTDDWTLDAGRRDFTINALYLSSDGVLFDPVGGLKDLANAQVRFIGDAKTRIAEDYLRILRFFRFSARFSKSYDRDGLVAINNAVSGIENLSRERVGSEFLKIMALPGAACAIDAMIEANVLSKVWHAKPQLEDFYNFKKIVPEGSAIVGLAALFGADITGLAARLRLSNREASYLDECQQAEKKLRTVENEKTARVRLYYLGTNIWRDAIFLACSRNSLVMNALMTFIDLPERWLVPQFPLSGQTLLDMGIKPGPQFSEILKETEERWVDNDFPDLDGARKILEEILRAKNNPARG